MKVTTYKAISEALDKAEKSSFKGISTVDFAQAVAMMMKEEFGTHNFETFLNIVNNELGEENEKRTNN